MSQSTHELIGRIITAPPHSHAGPAPRSATSVQPLEVLIGRMLTAPGVAAPGLVAEPLSPPAQVRAPLPNA